MIKQVLLDILSFATGGQILTAFSILRIKKTLIPVYNQNGFHAQNFISRQVFDVIFVYHRVTLTYSFNMREYRYKYLVLHF